MLKPRFGDTKSAPVTDVYNVQTGEWTAREYPPQPTDDWIGLLHLNAPYTNALAPYHGEELYATTPLFQWPDLGEAYQYRVRIYNAAGTLIRTLDSEMGKNYLLVPLNQLLPFSAEYRWTVESIAGTPAKAESGQRYFYVRADATAWEINVPGSGATLGERLYDKLLGMNGQTALAHPRAFPQEGTEMRTDMAKSLVSGDPRYAATQHVEFWLNNGWETAANPTEVSLSLGLNLQKLNMLSAYWKLGGTLATRARDLCKKILIAYITPYNGLTGSSAVGFKRGYGTINGVDQTNANTRYSLAAGTDQNCRDHCMIMARGYDLFRVGANSGTDLTQAEQTTLLEFFGFRAKAIYDDLYTGRDLQRYQYESHGINNIGYLAYACALIAENDMSAFPTDYSLSTVIPNVIKNLLPVWLHLMLAFRNDDGSAHNGGAYDNYDTVGNPMLLMSLYMFGVNLMDRPKYYNAVTWRLLLNGLPGTRSFSQFGDNAGQEAPYKAAYASLNLRYRSKLTAFAYSSINGTDFQTHQYAFTPSRGKVAPSREPEKLSGIFPSGGYYCSIAHWKNAWATHVAMRCSPHGGFNHAHHDVGHFTVAGGDATSGPRQLLIDGGYYNATTDAYGGAHWKYWHRHSRGHNVLSMDNGAGHQFNDISASAGDNNEGLMRGKGKMSYWKDAGDYSCAIADATTAFDVDGYRLSKCLRLIMHFRDDVILVFDYAMSDSGTHTWDWNFHTAEAVAYAGGVYTISSGTARAYVQNQYCNTPLQAPTAWASGARTSGQYNYTGWDSPPVETGTVTSGTTGTLRDTTKNWVVNYFKGGWGTVNGVDFKISVNTSNELTIRNLNGGLLASAPTGTYTFYPLHDPVTFGKTQAVKDTVVPQYHHRISTATPTLEFKSVTSICVGSNSLLSGVTVSSDAQSITFTGSIRGRSRTIVFNFVNKTVVVT